MPTGQHWLRFVAINVAFAAFAASVAYMHHVSSVKQNWPLYRCNPMYMWMADNVRENFAFCVQTTQSHFMGHLLQPLTTVTGSLTGMMGGFVQDIQNIRGMFAQVRGFLTALVENLFGTFLNIVVEFQRISAAIKDLVGKTVGTMVTVMYMMDGSVKTMQSTWNGPPGQLVRSMGKCFHPDTPVWLREANDPVPCAAVRPGDVLSDGSRVECTMRIDNRADRWPLYEFVDDAALRVTGSHSVWFEGQWRRVETLPSSVCRVSALDPVDEFVCFITDTHRIPLGAHVFWDWEDHRIDPSPDNQPR